MADKSRRDQLANLLGDLGDSINANWRDRLDKGLCPTCGDPVKEEDFRDELSRKEFALSHICQKCQDKIFQSPSLQ